VSFRDNALSSGTLLLLGGLLTVLQLTCSVLAIPASRRFAEADRSGEDPAQIVTAFDVVSMIVVIVTLAAWIVCSLWLSVAYDNARAVAPERLRRAKIWVWLGWWVPVVSLWFPKIIVDDVWSATATRTREACPPRGTAAWWTFWAAGLLITTGLTGWSMTGHTVTGGVVALEWVLTTCTIAAFALWVPIVRAVTATQAELARRSPDRPLFTG
jgi:hypothetical protein